MKASDEWFRRWLLLIPAVARRKEGMPVSELCAKLGIEASELQGALDQLLLLGKPPFSPADYLDVYVEGDRVHVELAQNLVRPPRLTHDEAMALALGARMLSEGGDEAWEALLGTVMEKLEAAMTPVERERYRRLSERVVLAPTAPPSREVQSVLRQALSQRRRVRMEYYSRRSDAFGPRTVRPYAVLHHEGYWYLVAGEEPSGGAAATEGEREEASAGEAASDHKLFRLDRIRRVEPVGPPGAYEIPEGFDLGQVRPGAGSVRSGVGAPAVVEVSAAKARWVAERFGERVTLLEDGRARVRFDGWSEGWIAAWVLSFGGEAVVIEPETLRARVRREAEAALEALRA
ncbi:MAG: WYL domain-containing protein [Deltaproteobacteria bacterium]|nr:MAG: WYL domain-containing protein [Deltaproteobacteria bacterium]